MLVAAALTAVFVFVASSVVMPSDVLGATATKAALCSANLRTSSAAGAPARTSIATGTKV